jgi:hypothetical protein
MHIYCIYCRSYLERCYGLFLQFFLVKNKMHPAPGTNTCKFSFFSFCREKFVKRCKKAVTKWVKARLGKLSKGAGTPLGQSFIGYRPGEQVSCRNRLMLKACLFFTVVYSGLPEACLFYQCCLFRFARSLPIFSVLSVPVCQ